jgi:hypothetical protein
MGKLVLIMILLPRIPFQLKLVLVRFKLSNLSDGLKNLEIWWEMVWLLIDLNVQVSLWRLISVCF